MKASKLKGQRLRIVVNETPCRCRWPDFDILTETVEGRCLGFKKMPGGGIGFIETDDGQRICFDADLDVKAGRIEIELLTH